MMFGDMGHGSILFMVGLFLVWRGNVNDDFPSSLRYILALMGFFAVYCGLIYNEFFALPLNLFDSCFEVETTSKSYTDALISVNGTDYEYLLGEDNY